MMKLKEKGYFLIGKLLPLSSFLLLLLVTISCTSNTILEKPDNLIPRDKMVNLLTDAALANAAENIRNIDEKRDVNYFTVIYDKYQIDSAQFTESSFYYASKIDDYNTMLEEVELRLGKKLDSLRAIRQEQDSIKNSKRVKKNRKTPIENIPKE